MGLRAYRLSLRKSLILAALVIVAFLRPQMAKSKSKATISVQVLENVSRNFSFHGNETNSSVAHTSLLAVVTGGWALEEYRDDKHFLYLHRILRNYVEMCEAGVHVQVYLITYESEDAWRWENYVDLSSHRCYRAAGDFSANIRKFELRSLPHDSFGTAGDLAFRHREIFIENLHRFEYFLLQEDDVSVSMRAVEYFVHQSRKLRGTSFYPGFVFQEIEGGTWYSDFRLRQGSIFAHSGELFFVSKKGTSPCMYMLAREELLHLSRRDGWLDVSAVKGEFNVAVGTYAFMIGWKTIVIPVRSWTDATYHHMSNKYRRMSTPDVGENNPLPGDSPITQVSQSDVFANCLGRSSQGNIDTKGSCRTCLEKDLGVELEITLTAGKDQAHRVLVSYHCVRQERLTSYVGKLFPR